MAVKCNIPNLALKAMHSLLYGFGCEETTKKIVQNYLEYLKCPGIDYSFCDDFPCVAPSGTVVCTVADVDLEVDELSNDTVVLVFTPPEHSYVLEVIDEEADTVVYTQNNPTSPVTISILSNDTNYLARLTVYCPGGEIRVTEVPFQTLPVCVNITNFTGVAAITP